jgi:hypothetical protein
MITAAQMAAQITVPAMNTARIRLRPTKSGSAGQQSGRGEAS